MAEIEKLSGIKITTSIKPILRVIKSLTNGTKDLIISGATSPAFRKTVSLGVIGYNRTIIVTNNKVAVLRLTEFSRKIIGFVSGGFL